MKALEAVAPIRPSARALWWNALLLKVLGPLGRWGLRRWLDRVEVVGAEHLARGPLLVLMNHSHALDPLVLALHAPRPVHFLVTEPAMFSSLRGRLLSWFGQVPKRKLEADPRSARTMKAWCALGGVVAVFPEGVFPWDGRLGPLQPGLAQLVHQLGVPVVTVRQVNGDRVWPVWAKRARQTAVRLEIDPPVRFEPGDPVEARVAERLSVDPDGCARWPVRGTGLALGLSDLLVLCPVCGRSGMLRDVGNDVLCDACGRRYAVGTDNRLRSEGMELDIRGALDRVFEHLKGGWHGAPSMVSRGDVELLDATASQWQRVAKGTLALEAGRLSLPPGWTLELHEVIATTLDWGQLLLLRTARRRWALRMPVDSRALWSFALDEARR